MTPSILIDARNFDQFENDLISRINAADFVGYDIETFDQPHAGIKAFRKNNDAKCFDARRTVVTGFSIYPEGDAAAYYINLNHADVENRLPWAKARRLLEARKEDAYWVCHNAPYELTMMSNSLDYELGMNTICTMQMAVSAYGPDDYDKDAYARHNLGEMQSKFPMAARVFATADAFDRNFDSEQGELLSAVLGKQSKAKHSYNGVIGEISYGYSLKKAVKSHFNYQMATFKETLGAKKHMGELTGEEVCSYGADDAYWAVRLFRHLLGMMAQQDEKLISTFFEQENPMIHVFSSIWKHGLRINVENVKSQQQLERTVYAGVLRKLKAKILETGGYPIEHHKDLLDADSWYAKNPNSYRSKVWGWAQLPNLEDDYGQILQVSGAVSATIREERGLGKSTGVNLSYYMTVRSIMYDLFGQKLIKSKGKTQSDAEARGKMLERSSLTDLQREILHLLADISSIEQRMKLYLNPYLKLIDPDTGRMYPQVSSMLATRRMAMSNPNGMQLAKRGDSTYVRGFYEADNDDHVVVSADWSQIELVLIGELSGDPEFFKAYGQLPYVDLHLGAAADALQVVIPEMTEDLMNRLDRMSTEEVNDINPLILTKPDGTTLDPGKAKKYWRTEVGKGSNFNYWYSGALSTVGDRLGWSSDQMWAATEAYRERFAVAEAWRIEQIEKAGTDGYITLPDGHRRNRYECTPTWRWTTEGFFKAWEQPGIDTFGKIVAKRLQSRANNQIVNAMIQGSCATLAKRAILRGIKMIADKGYDARFMMPIHDELVWSVRRSEARAFINDLRYVMTHGDEDVIKNLKVHCTVSVGATFEPFHPKKAPFGQIELDELPRLEFLPESSWDGVANDNQVVEVLDYLKKAA